MTSMQSQNKAENYMFPFGRFRGKKVREIDLLELDSWLGWAENVKEPTMELKRAILAATSYLNHPDVAPQVLQALEEKENA
jgi:hypothetical protein